MHNRAAIHDTVIVVSAGIRAAKANSSAAPLGRA